MDYPEYQKVIGLLLAESISLHHICSVQHSIDDWRRLHSSQSISINFLRVVFSQVPCRLCGSPAHLVSH
jgi:hypothetical protein